jgi:hypothetical protein
MFFREYDPVLGRMTAVDPMAGKYRGVTPYNYAFNDPIAFNDPSGADPCAMCPGGNSSLVWGTYSDGSVAHVDTSLPGESWMNQGDSYLVNSPRTYGGVSPSRMGNTGTTLAQYDQMAAQRRADEELLEAARTGDPIAVRDYGRRFGNTFIINFSPPNSQEDPYPSSSDLYKRLAASFLADFIKVVLTFDGKFSPNLNGVNNLKAALAKLNGALIKDDHTQISYPPGHRFAQNFTYGSGLRIAINYKVSNELIYQDKEHEVEHPTAASLYLRLNNSWVPFGNVSNPGNDGSIKILTNDPNYEFWVSFWFYIIESQ